MKLSDYLKAEGITATAFANRIGRSKSTVTRAMRGQSIPDKETMDKIVAETGGQVLPNDFYGSPEAAA